MNQVKPDNERVGVEIWAQTNGVERLDLCSVCDTPIVAGRVVLPRFMPAVASSMTIRMIQKPRSRSFGSASRRGAA